MAQIIDLMATRAAKSEPRRISCADTAKLVRAALKQSFPGVKFSVTSKTYSGGASVDVSWTDGPTTKEVDAISKQFEGASFDGMIDLKEYHASTLNGERVRFGADFVMSQRNYSVELMTRAAHMTCERYGLEMPEIKVIGAGQRYENVYPFYEVEPRVGNDWATNLICSQAHELS